MKFRKDINGLRAIAVIAVVLFHFHPSGLSGGFAGVDVFFVISGFLMTGIIFRGIDQDNFSVLKFYVARASRIIPAMATLCLILLVFGFVYLTPLDYKVLGKHITGSMVFISNILYWRESGYFDATTLNKWLLHTWSLSVEWQFYIVYPLVLVSINKFISKQAMKSLILISAILSFALCVIITFKKPDVAYYLLPARLWEMLMGGVAYLYPFSMSKKKKKALELTGLVFIVGSFFLVSADTPWPGYIALFPVLGSFFVIQSQRSESVFTGNIIFEKVGLWSYSVYLWHWPVVVAIYYFSFNSIYVVYIGLGISLFLGYFSYTYIESVRFDFKFNRFVDVVRYKLTYMALLLVVLGYLVFTTGGLSFIYSDTIQEIIYSKTDSNPRTKECVGINKKCIFGNGDVSMIVVGDSHALSSVSAISESIASYNKSVLFYSLSSCATLIGDFNNKESPRCSEFMNWFMEDINDNELPVVIINSGAYPVGAAHLDDPENKVNPIIEFPMSKDGDYEKEYIERSIETNCEIGKKHKVFLVRPYPRMLDSVPEYMLRQQFDYIDSEYKIDKSKYLKSHKAIYEAQDLSVVKCNSEVIDATKVLCDKFFCYGSENLRPVYFDTNHLTEQGASLLQPVFKEKFKSLFGY